MVMVKQETRKGPWTEQEDLQLACSVRVLGDRRWDFIAKVSGLNRTGKSCRLRWVNYLHPGLRRGRMTPQEERLVLDLHSRWGNKWSRIARRLPGRTDNEIKNYWRTQMRKKAQERRISSPGPSSSTSSVLDELQPVKVSTAKTNAAQQGAVGGGTSCGSAAFLRKEGEEVMAGYPMDQIWSEIPPPEMSGLGCYEEALHDEEFSVVPCTAVASPPWGGYSCDSLWKMDDEEFKMFLPQ
ncbi:hypothetical protein Taro_019845 [Colocasia esculenta]|uniref:Uncharacterized protein n=1 Tax=Colocasia esculenta TaxID=4460 RepID=A0A843UUW4_COLES|nr:hypothetical protein [Colocasia esculenta]